MKDYLGKKETRECLEYKVHGDPKVIEGKWVCLAFLVSMGTLEAWDPQVCLVDMVKMDVTERM